MATSGRQVFHPVNAPASYRGRFAPTPSGPLHFGSLLAAVASWVDARSHNGTWLLRIEDVDPPRCPEGASDTILRQLEAYGLYWDGPVLYQHSRHAAYQHALETLITCGQAYSCGCSRKEWQDYEHYPGWCRQGNIHPERPSAWKLNTSKLLQAEHVAWNDRRLGIQTWKPENLGDVVLKRRDGLWAYQLAVVVDDAAQGITDIVRGIDLLDNTPWQLLLQQDLHYPAPRYLHLPLMRSTNGQKLSKQNLAPALPETPHGIRLALHQAIQSLGQHPPIDAQHASVDEQLTWAVQYWDSHKIPSNDLSIQDHISRSER